MKLLSSVLGGIGLGVVAALFTLGACGGDKSVPTGTGGSNANVGGSGNTAGGSTGVNNSAGGSTSTSTGGTSTASTGPKVVPTNPLMTDFSTMAEGTTITSTAPNMNWGDSSKTLTGGTFIYTQDATDAPTGTVTNGALVVTASIAASHYSGFGFYFGPNSGSDATAYTGFSFTISGNLAGTTVDVQVQTTPDYPLNDNSKGTCDWVGADASSKYNYCKFPHVALATLIGTGGAVSATVQTVQAPWTAFSGGNPQSTVDQKQLLGIQFQFNCGSTACTPNIAIDNLTFY